MMWDKLFATYHATIIQNNFELPGFRLLGNKKPVIYMDVFILINALNTRFYDYANQHSNFYIHDIHYLSA